MNATDFLEEKQSASAFLNEEPDLSKVELTPYDKYKLAVSQGATPESFSEIQGLPPSLNPDYDATRFMAQHPLQTVSDVVTAPIKMAETGIRKVMDLPDVIQNKLQHTEDVSDPRHHATFSERSNEGEQPIIKFPRSEGTGVVAGGLNTVSDLATSFLGNPEKIVSLALTPGEGAVGKTAAGAFGAQTALSIPDAIKNAYELTMHPSPDATVAQEVEALAQPVIQGAFAREMLKHATSTKGVPNASQNREAAEVHGDVPAQSGQGQGQVPAQEGGAGVRPQGQVPLSQEHADLLAPHFNEDQHTFGKLPGNSVMMADHASGKIVIDPEQFGKWVDRDLKGLSPKRKAAAVKSAFDHEDIHLKTDPEDGEPYWNSLSPFEQGVLKRQYLKGGPDETPANLGLEAIRNHIERASGMTRSDFVGMALKERWTAQALDALANVVGKVRRLRDKELNAHQKSILDKVMDNINAARVAVPPAQTTQTQDESKYTEGPFMRRQEEPPKEGMVRLYRGHDGAEGGVYWSSDKTYASRMGPKMEYVDIPADQLGDHAVRSVEGSGTPNAFKLPPDLTKGAQPMESGGVPTHNLDDLESPLPKTAPGERIVLVRRPDGSIYRAAYSGKKYDVSAGGKTMIEKYGGAKVDSIGTINERGEWTHGLLPKGDKIVKGFSPYAAVERSGEPEGPAMRRKQDELKLDLSDMYWKPAFTVNAEPGSKPAKISDDLHTFQDWQKEFDRVTPSADRMEKELPGLLEEDEVLRSAFNEHAEEEGLSEKDFTNLVQDYIEGTSSHIQEEYPWLQQLEDHIKEHYPEVYQALADKHLEPGYKAINFAISQLVDLGQMDGTGAKQAVTDPGEWRDVRGGVPEGLREFIDRTAFPNMEFPKVEQGPAMRRKSEKAGEQPEMFGAITQKGVPGGEDVQPVSARQAGALEFTPEQKIFPKDLAFGPKSYGQGSLPLRPITASEAKSAAELSKFLTADARKEGSDLPVSMSRRLTVLFDKTDGTVHLVSTYRGDNVARMVDPEIAGKERNSRPVGELLHRYQPVASVLLAEPRQGFHQKFDSMAEFQEKFGNEASAMMREQSTGTEGIPQTRMSQTPIREPGQVERGVHPSEPFQLPKEQREPNFARPTTEELKAFHDFFGDTPPSDALMFSRRIEAQAANASRSMINGLRKLVRIERGQTRGLSEGEALGRVLDRLYENFNSSETRSEFVQRTMEQSRLGAPEEIPAGGAPRATGARELSTLRSRAPTTVEGAALGKGAPEPQLPEVRPQETLSPQEQAVLDAELRKRHPPQFEVSPRTTLGKQVLETPVPKEPYTVGKSRALTKLEYVDPDTGETYEVPYRADAEMTEEELDARDAEEKKQLELMPERELRSEPPPKPTSTKESLVQEKKAVAKGEGNKGQLDFWKKQGPAMRRQVDDTVEKVKDYLAKTGANIKSAGNLSDDLYRLKTSEKADNDLALPVIKSALKIIPEKDRPVLLQYADEMQVLKKSDIKLTDAQEAMYQTFLKPLMDDNQRMYKSLMRAGIPVGESTYLGRMVQDTHSLYNRLWRGTKQRITEGSLLGQGASFFKRRVFKSLEDADGNRRLIALVGDGKDTRVIGYEKGKGELLGKMPPESLEPRPLTAQQIRTQRIVEARRLQELDKLDKEEQALLKEKDRLSKDPHADPAVLKELDDRLASINGDYAEVGEKYPSPVFDIPRMWRDNNGKVWKFTDATINEIQQHTNTRYYQEPMSGVITQNLKLKQIYRANAFLEDLKNSPDFQRISRSVNERNVPEDWRTVDLPQFRGLRIEPRTADVLDLFAQEQAGPALPMKYVTKLTGFLRNALFVWNPFVHEPNLLAHWFTARGLEWMNPAGYARMVKSGVQSLTDVMTRSRFRDEALRSGAPLLRGMGNINRQVLNLLRKELDPNPSMATKLARGLGYVNPLRMIRAFGDSLTWGTNEVLTLQLIRETMDRTGLSMEEAISEVGKHMPNYRIPPRVLNSRLIAHVLRNPLVAFWGHYHYGALRSYGEMGKEIFSPSSSMKTRMEGLGRVATIGFLLAVAYPAIDDIVNKVLKTKGLKMRRAGSATVPQNLMELAQGKKTPEAVAQSIITPSPVAQGAAELMFNRNLRTGLPVYERRLGMQTAKDLGSFAANKISPVEEGGKVFGGKKSLEEFGLGLAGITRTRTDSAMSQFGRMADNWMRTNSDESIREQYKRRTQDVFQESDYQLLRSAIIRQDNRAAEMAVNKLLKNRKPEEVARRIKQWQDSPFTGTRKTDKALMEEMTPQDWDLWYQAAQERLDIADGMRNALVDSLVKEKP